MTLDDIFMVLAERYSPPFPVRGTTVGLDITTPDGVLTLPRRRVQDCNSLAELRAYIKSRLPA